jgi:murein L,D-transpeptidase YafK
MARRMFAAPSLVLFAALSAHPCLAAETAVVVRVAERALVLCDGGRPVGRYAVALGIAGVGKQRTGDNKTPLGRYPLGRPRPSSSYDTFVPVGYPTAAQQRLGLSGNAIGIHGPPRGFGGSGAAIAGDWTAGCIAVGSDGDIRNIAAWIRRHRAGGVRIE